MTYREEIEQIHLSLINGQRVQMVQQIDMQSLYEFWYDYKAYLHETYTNMSSILEYFSDCVISYHRIKNR